MSHSLQIKLFLLSAVFLKTLVGRRMNNKSIKIERKTSKLNASLKKYQIFFSQNAIILIFSDLFPFL